jgi:hypothetical protein
VMPRKLLIASVVITAVVTTASDTTDPKRVVTADAPAAALLSPHAGPAILVASINGGGTANMDDGAGTSHWGTSLPYQAAAAPRQLHALVRRRGTF